MFPKGDQRDPMTEDEIAVKFTALGGEVIAKDQCKKLQHCIMNIDSTKDVDEYWPNDRARDGSLPSPAPN